MQVRQLINYSRVPPSEKTKWSSQIHSEQLQSWFGSTQGNVLQWVSPGVGSSDQWNLFLSQPDWYERHGQQSAGAVGPLAWCCPKWLVFHQTGSQKDKSWLETSTPFLRCLLDLWLLTAKDAPTGLRIHLGGFLRGVMVLGDVAVWGSCKGGSVLPVPKGSIFPNELLNCWAKEHQEQLWADQCSSLWKC